MKKSVIFFAAMAAAVVVSAAPTRIQPRADGVLQLDARAADIHGQSAKFFEGRPDFIGTWIGGSDYLSWPVAFGKAGAYIVELCYACGPDSTGSQFEIKASKASAVSGIAYGTGSWNDYEILYLGEFSVSNSAPLTLTLKRKGTGNKAMMNLAWLRFIPANDYPGYLARTDAEHQVKPVRLPAKVFVVPDFHPASCGWLANWSVERNYCANSYLDHLDRVRDDANYGYVQSECNNLIAIRDFQPERFAEMQKLIKEGRVELVNAFFIEPTINLSGGEALAKMGIEGLRWQQAVMGVRPRFCWAIDTCGTHAQMPQLCDLLGLDALIYTRCNRSGKTVFWSESPDGSRILTLVPGRYSDNIGGTYGAKEPVTEGLMQAAAKAISTKVSSTPAGAPVLILGGQLVIGAGGEYDPALNAGFDPDRWTEAAWLDGGGILPAPLKSGFLGATPREQGKEIKPFFLSFESLQSHAYFKLAGVGDDELRDLYAEPFFFKAVQPDVSGEAVQALLAAEIQRLDDDARFLVAVAARSREAAAGQGQNGEGQTGKGVQQNQAQTEDQSRLSQVRPAWLLWSSAGTPTGDDQLPQEAAARERRLAELAEQTRPRILARFNDPAETPFLMERQIGRGTVLLVTTGLLSDWNTLPKTNAMLIFDRVLRSMVESTLPPRNFPPQERLTLSLPAAARDATVTLRRPGGEGRREALDVGYISREQLGVTVPRPLTRGLYRVVASRSVANGGQPTEETVWETPLAINGLAAESELTPLARDDFEARVGSAAVRWVGPDEEISLAGSQIRGQASWWWLILAVLALLLLELIMLAAPMWRRAQVTLQQA